MITSSVRFCTQLLIPIAQSSLALRVSGSTAKAEFCDKVNTLGLIFDSNLTFSDHVTLICNQRAAGGLRGLSKFKNMLLGPAKLQLMQSLVLSMFFYC